MSNSLVSKRYKEEIKPSDLLHRRKPDITVQGSVIHIFIHANLVVVTLVRTPRALNLLLFERVFF